MELLKKLGSLFKKPELKKVEQEPVKLDVKLDYLVMPDFRGRVAQEAVDWCKANNVKYAFTNLQPGWRLGNISIRTQSLAPGSRVLPKKIISFTVINQVSY